MRGSGNKKSIGDIAIIGMAGRFPGARDVRAFWQNLKNGIESVSFFTDAELAAAGVAPELLADPNYVKARAMLEDVEAFDAELFGYSPRDAEMMDPQHRLFLETAWAALEDAGYDSWRYGGAIGTFGGLYFDTYLLANLCADPRKTESLLNHSEPGSYQMYLGNDKDYLTSRVAYKLNLRGPAITVQTACSTSLVAVCQACQSLLYYQCDMALAGGVAVIVPQQKGYLYQDGGMQSRDGHCKPFDAQAQGTLFGNGVGLVVLKRLDEAVADGDHIYAVIKGSAINNDGAVKVSYTAPSIDGQSEVIVLAQTIAGVSADTINYVEAHGTGTPLGDPIEVAALTQAFRESTDKRGFCGIGSLKSNVGHLDAAAGVAGLIKAALALENELIPATLHFTSPNPKIDFASSPFYVVSKPTEWKTNDAPRRAGVSAFGVGGTNAHVVLEEAPAIEPSGSSRGTHLLKLSAKTPAALDRATAQLAAHLKTHLELNLADVAYTLEVGRRILPQRRVVVCHDTLDAAAQLEKPDPKRVFIGRQVREDAPVVFMFPGQGSQYVGMGANLYDSEHVFREVVDRCAEFLQPMLQTDLRLILFPVEGLEKDAEQLLVQTRFTQPALFVIEYALATLWISWGIKPVAMIGHSVGEYVAACLAGVFSLEDGLTLIAERARLVQQQPGGAMLAVGLPEKEVLQWLDGTGTGEMAIAAINSPGMCVVAGPHEDIAELETKLSSREVTFRHLRTSHAFHSPMMEPVLAPFTEVVRQISLHAPQIPYVSNVTAQWITEADATDPHYWAGHVRQAVRFAEGIAHFVQDPATVLLEVGPGQTLSTLARQHPDWKREQAVLSSLVRGEEADSIIAACGRLWLAGTSVDAEAFFANERRKRVSLPTYSFERTRHWVESNGVTWTATAATTPALDLRATERTSASGATTPAKRTDELKAMLKELSGKDYSDADDNVSFVELGFESLFLTQLSLAITKRFGVQVAFRQLLGDINTLALLAAHLDIAAPPAIVEPVAPVLAATEPQTAPLTEAQRELWLATAIGDAASCVFNQSSTLRLRGPLQQRVLESAFQELVQRHDGLRATFSENGDSQTVAPRLAIDLPFSDLTGRATQLDALLADEASRPFDLAHGPLVRARLVRLDQNNHIMLFTVHHIVCDGRSLAILSNDLGELYSAKCAGRAALLVPAQSLMAYAVEEYRQTESPERRAAESYWIEQYADQPPALELPPDFPRPAQKSFHGALAKFELPPALCSELNRAGARQGCTFFTILLAAYYVLLYRLTGQEDIVVGVPFATPGTEGSESLVGHTVNFLAVRDHLSGNSSWGDHLQAVKRLVIEAVEHRHFTYGSLIQKLALARDNSRIPLVAASFNLARRDNPLRFTDLQVTKELNPHSFTNLDITFDFNQDGDTLTLDCVYNTDLFDAATINRWFGHFETLLNAIAESPTEVLGKLPVLGEIERREQIVDWNNTAVEIPKHAALYRWFESQVEKTPEARALTFEREHLTYGELNHRANQLAWHLKKLGVGPHTLVGLYVERSLEMVVGLLGILKAGGAYVPLDPSFPVNRLAYMVSDSGMDVLITHRNLEKNLPVQPASVVRLDSDWGEIAKQGIDDLKSEDAGPGDLAYVLYTSGSTGKPKGVGIPHSAVTNFLSSMQREPGFTATDSLLAVTTLSFDIAGLEIYLPLISGGSVVIASYDDSHDPARLMELIRNSHCSMLQATPATWRALIDAGWSGSPTLTVLCGGESLPRDLAKDLLPRCRELWNMYGPTETTIWSTVHRVTSTDGPIPIGRPIANTKTFVLDAYRNLAPAGAVGELYIGGAGLARGYLGRPELTQERFIQSPFDTRARLYRTGDIARWLPGGILECLGRVDSQVKIRGFRIELGEIEAVLSLHPGIRQCAAIAREDLPGNARLVAYFEAQPGQTLNVTDLRASLEKNLPAYMIPSVFVVMEKLPLTNNGKIDRKSLPAPEQSVLIRSEFVAPEYPSEQMLARIWTKVLKVKRVGRHDNFFELGGHSLLAVRLVVEIEKLTKIRLPLAMLLQAPTIAGLADLLRRENWTPSWSCLVPIQSAGSKPPLFLMHAHGGNVLEYYPLANLLGPDQPVYALQARGLNGHIVKDSTLEDMAAAYITELRSLQPEGPYFLGGFCFGGLLALEVAQQLTAAGQAVALLAMIQSVHPEAWRFKPGTSVFQRAWYRATKRISLESDNLLYGNKGYIVDKLRYVSGVVRARIAIAVGSLTGREHPDPTQLPMQYILETLGKVHEKALKTWVPRPYGGRVVLFRASKQMSGLAADQYLGWKHVFNGNLEVREIPGHQQNLLLEPNVLRLATEFTNIL